MPREQPAGPGGVRFVSFPVYARRKAKPAPLRLSPTAVATFRQCRQLYRFLYIDRLGGRYARARPYYTMANHVHATLRDLLRLWPPQRRTEEVVEGLLRKNWRRYRIGFSSAEDERRWGEKALAQLRAFMASQDVGVSPLLMEEPVEAQITPGVVLRCRVDRVDREPDGSLHVIDYKTGSVPTDIDWTQLELQALALSLRLPSPVRRLSYLYLGPSVLHSTALAAEGLAGVRWRLLAVAAGIRRERRYRPCPGPWCRGCDFRAICPSGVQVEPAAGMEGQLELWDDFGDEWAGSL